nr:Mor transcription activator family protein [uncultured Desulfobulbus sp.]
MENSVLKIEGMEVPAAMLPKIEELPRSLQEVAEIVGIEKTIALSNHFQGTTVAFPMLAKFKRKIRNAALREDYDRGATVAELARKYGLAERQTWNILSAAD